MNNIWNVTEEGYIYSTKKLQLYNDTHLLGELEMLYSEDLAEKNNDGDYVLKHEVAASFTTEKRNILQLPDVFPYLISIKTNGSNFKKKTFRYIVEYKNLNGTLLINPSITESYVKVNTDLDFMFNLEQFQLVKTAIECNKEIQSILKTDAGSLPLLKLAKIKKLGAKVDAEFEDRIKNEKVLVPDKLSVNVKRIDNDTIEIEPILLVENDATNYEQIDSSYFNYTFNSRDDVQDVYMCKNSTKYVVEHTIKDALKQIKTNKIMKGEKAKRFLAQPTEVLDSHDFKFSEKDILCNWDGQYSDRVTGIVDYQKTSIPLYRSDTGSWLPSEGESGRTVLYDVVTKENVVEVNHKIIEAQQKGMTKIVLGVESVDLTPTFIAHVERLLDEEKRTSDRDDKDVYSEFHTITKDEYRKKILGIFDNFDNVDYVAKDIQKNFVSDYYCGLVDSIKLYNHQKDGIKWITECYNDGKKGVLVADDMGLGKTMQALAFISAYKKQVGVGCDSVLVVAPVALLKNWREEYYKFVKPKIFDGIEELHSENIKKYKVNDEINLTALAKDRIVFTTYETLRDAQLSFAKIEWSIVVADEAQKIKNPTIMTTLALKAMRYNFAICLTGTPVENSWVDLWSIMDFAVPGNSLSSINDFNNSYTKKLKMCDDKKGILTLAQELENKIKPFYIRRMKNNTIQDLPKKNVFKRPRIMPEAQAKAYDSVVKKAHEEKKLSRKGYMLELLAKIRDISLYPDLGIINPIALEKTDVNVACSKSARLAETFEILDNIKKRNEKVLVFTISRKMQKALRFWIEKKYNIHVPIPISGAVSGEKRQEIIEDFNAKDGFNVLILSPEAGGVGFNITSANNVIHLSRCWNPAKEDQATDRAYRIGQNKDVNVYIPLAIHPSLGEEASFDYKLDALLEYKRNLSENIFYPMADSDNDGLNIIHDITNDINRNNESSTDVEDILTLDDMSNIDGLTFEKVIQKVAAKKFQCPVEFTTVTNDHGADLIVWLDLEKNEGILIQCKQTSMDKNCSGDGVAEVNLAVPYYQKKYHAKFKGCVVTNAHDFTINAKDSAKACNVQLIASVELGKLLEQYQIMKFY